MEPARTITPFRRLEREDLPDRGRSTDDHAGHGPEVGEGLGPYGRGDALTRLGRVRLLPHDCPFGIQFAGRGTIELHDAKSGEVFAIEGGRDQVPSWVRDAAFRVLRVSERIAPVEEWSISLFKGLRATAPLAKQYGQGQLSDLLERWRVVDDKADLPMWSAASWPEGATTCKGADVIEVSCLVLDYDDGQSIEEALRRWSRWAHLVHTTASHTEAAPRFRVVLPLAQPIPAPEWPRVWRWASRGQRIDEKAKDAGRRFFLPGGLPTTLREVRKDFRRPLLWLDLDTLPQMPRPVEIPRPPPPPKVTLPYSQAVREVAERLKTDPASRERAGLLLGGRVHGEYIRDVNCPGCARPSLYWPVIPAKTPKALCGHKNSCGQSYWLDQLLERL